MEQNKQQSRNNYSDISLMLMMVGLLLNAQKTDYYIDIMLLLVAVGVGLAGHFKSKIIIR